MILRISAILAVFGVSLLVAESVSLNRTEPPAPVGIRVTGKPRLLPPPTYVVRSKWTILRNQPVGLAIGNARKGWGMEVGSPANFGYLSGFVRGNFRACAWTTSHNVVRSTGAENSICANFNPPLKSFISKLNCITCHGGTAVALTSAAEEFANFSPGGGPTDALRKVPAGHCVEWRWVSVDQRMVMVKDRSFANNLGSWIFVPRSSLPAKLPSGFGSSCRSWLKHSTG